MDEWTEQEEQQIIERAKTGDPEANYTLSLWALRRGEEEPDEPRWNRLAAKCLVKAAQAGYGPAKEQMAALLGQANQNGQSEQTPSPAPTTQRTASPAPSQRTAPSPSRPAPKRTSGGEAEVEDGETVPSRRGTAVRRSAPTARPAEAVRRLMSLLQKPREDEDRDQGFDVNEASWDDGYDDESDGEERGGRSSRTKRRSGRRWGDDKWRLLEGVCVLVCVALLIAIAVMLISRRHDSGEDSNSNSSIPPAGEVGSVDNSGAVPADGYPDTATQTAIMAADLDIFPSPEDYVTEATTGTVSVSSEYLRLRKGPNTTYDAIAQMPNGTAVSVFAKKNDWDLILYQGGSGPIYGWCSSEYLIITAGTAAGPGASAAPTDAPGAAEG